MRVQAANGHWVTTWAASIQGAYPLGSAIGQPDLSVALPDTAAGASAQSMRMVVMPGLWSPQVRLRLSNVFGDRDIAFHDLCVGLHQGGGALVPGTCCPVADGLFVVPAGQARWTPTLTLPWAQPEAIALLQGRCLAVSWHVNEPTGPMSWHAKAMGTSYLSTPGQPIVSDATGSEGYPHTTTSWFFIDALDAWLPAGTGALVALGDSLTDGTATTLNGHDRWTDVLQRALWAAGRSDVAVVNAGIGGNQVSGPRSGGAAVPWRGGPAAIDRLERDVLSLSGLRSVVWIQGINDFSDNGDTEAATVLSDMRAAVARLRDQSLHVIGATLPSALGGTRPGHGSERQDRRRRAFNDALRTSGLHDGLFDSLIDLDAVMTDPHNGRLHSPFNGDSTFGEPGDGVHPNRAGHAAIAAAVLALGPW